MNASQTSTLTHPHITAYNGATALPSCDAMDVDTDGQRLGHHYQDHPMTDSPADGGTKATLDKGKAPVSRAEGDAPATGTESIAATDPTQVLERPREGGDEGARESPKQMPAIVPPPPLPLTADLISLYGLQPLAASVARFDSVTGEKINKMRKSYEGQLKTLGLSGRNRAVKHDPEKGMGLRELTMWPEEEWQNQKVAGKDVQNGMPADIMAKLEKAMQMQPGPLPNNSEWEDQLGHEKIKQTEAKASKLSQNTITKQNTQINGAITSTNPEAIRPKRTGRKRRYDEHSFEGYGEGYVDDDVDIGGYSSGDTQFSRRSSSNKKRKKDYASSPTGYPERTGSLSSNMPPIATYGR